MAPHPEVTLLRTPSSAARMQMKKSQSCDFLKSSPPSSVDDDIGGGVRLDMASLSLSPTPKKVSSKAKSVTGAEGTRSPIRTTFQVATNSEDDVFTESSHSSHVETPSPVEVKEIIAMLNKEAVDAQTLFMSSACVFVANLSQSHDDYRLESEVTRAFSSYGPVFVKIRRDGKHMPFAFCQFTDEKHAQKAEKFGKNTVILGRPCRTEMARAHASFIVYKISGEETFKTEAADVLGHLGEVQKADYLEEDIRMALQLPRSVVVTYQLYDPKRDVLGTFQDHRVFRVIPYDPKINDGPHSAARPTPARRHNLEQSDRDRRSAFVGNLPLDMTEDIFYNLSNSYGEVVDIQLFKKLVPGGNGMRNCFGFVEYAQPDAPDKLMRNMNGKDIDGYRLRIERKQSRSFETPRRSFQQPVATPHSGSTYSQRRSSAPFTQERQLNRFESPTAHHGVAPLPGAPGSGPSSSGTSYGRFGGRARSAAYVPGPSPSPAYASENIPRTTGPSPSSLRRVSSSVKKPEPPTSDTRVVVSSSLEVVSEEDGNETSSPKPNTPNEERAIVKKESALQERDMPPPSAMAPWMGMAPAMNPYSYGYHQPMPTPYMAGAPMTPQATPGMMYPGYMQYAPMPMYPDGYGNMMFSPPGPMMPAYGAPIPGVYVETPTRSNEAIESTGKSTAKPKKEKKQEPAS